MSQMTKSANTCTYDDLYLVGMSNMSNQLTFKTIHASSTKNFRAVHHYIITYTYRHRASLMCCRVQVGN